MITFSIQTLSKTLTLLKVSLLILSSHLMASESINNKKIAILISSYNNSEHPSLSYDLEELAQAYLVLHDNGISLDIISPKGGAVLIKNNKDDLPYINRFKHQTKALEQLKSTIKSSDALTKKYDGLMIIGGDGAMFDLPTDKATQKFIYQFIQSNSPIAAVCHGPAALVNIKNHDGQYWIKGKQVNSFTQAEDNAFKSDVLSLYPFIIEDKLKQRGAIFKSNSPMLPYISVDQNLITAQNPIAVAKAAEALVLKLALKIKPRILFKDEATLELIMKARVSGSYLIDLAMNSQAEKYDLNYLALYGFYSYPLATNKQDKLTELSIMQAVSCHFNHPSFNASLIKAEIEQGFMESAKNRLTRFKLHNPKHHLLIELESLIKS